MAEPDFLMSLPGVRRQEPMARHSQYGIGGPADWFVQLTQAADLAALVAQCVASGIALSVVGAGSNSLIQDGGIRGVVVEYMDRSMALSGDTRVRLGGGVMMPRAALDCARQGIAGLEFGIGVPGTVGASVRGNAGAFGCEIKDVLIDCELIRGDSGEMRTVDAADCGFGFRMSDFKCNGRGDIIVAASFKVTRDDPAAVRQRTDTIQAQRKATQPYGIRSLGSVFTNPPGGHAGLLLDGCGLKGLRHGGAEISPKHANFIVNRDNARASDVVALMEHAHAAVLERYGIDLIPEIVVMGEPAGSPHTVTP